ncbi:MAG TPA: LPS export ABC transporter permease LptF [Geobacteraceae bacterium]|nr:LPS export ABC transporter permease LptF [Geobacteraceae bacterium]
MKKILYFYIFKEITVPFVLGFSVFTFVLLMGKLLQLAEMVVAKGMPFSDILRLVAYMLPSFCVVTIPMSFLLAVLLAFGRLSSDSEITAMKACKISLYGLLPPVAAFGLIAFAISMFVTIYALPWGNSSFKIFLYDVIKARISLNIKEKVFNDNFPGMVLYVDKYDQKRHFISDILIYDDRKPNEPSTIFAKSGAIATDADKKEIRLSLRDGSIHRNPGKINYHLVEFANYDLSINMSQASPGVKTDEQDMSFSELRQNINNPSTDAKSRTDLLLELHKRLAFPFACFIFVVIGIPLGMQNQRSGKAAGFSMSICVIIFNYILFSMGKTLGQKGLLYPAIAMWLPNLTLLAIGFYLFKKTAEERKIPILEIRPAVAALARRIALKHSRPS